MDKPRTLQNKTALLNLMTVIIGLFAIFILLMVAQTRYAVDRQRNNAVTRMQNAEHSLEENRDEATENWAYYTNAVVGKVNTAALAYDSGGEVQMSADQLIRSTGLSSVALYNADGTLSEGIPCRSADALEGLLDGIPTVLTDENGIISFWCSKQLKDGRFLIASQKCTDYYLAQQRLGDFSNIMPKFSAGGNSFLLLLDPEFGTLVYAPAHFTGGAVGDEFRLDTHDDAFIVIDGVRYSYTTYQGSQYLFIDLVPQAEISNNSRAIVLLMCLMFAVVVIIVTAYVYFVEDDIEKRIASEKGEEKQARFLGFRMDSLLFFKSRNIMIMALIGVFTICCFLQMLSAVFNQHTSSEKLLQSLDQVMIENESRIDNLVSQYAQDYTSRAKEIAFLLQKNPELLKQDSITRMAETQGVQTLYVFDEKGKTEVTNDVYKDFVLSSDPEDQSYAFWSVVKGYTEVLAQEPREDTVAQRMMQYIGVRRLDKPGMVQIGINSDVVYDRLAHTELDQVIQKVSVENGGFIFAVDQATGALMVWPSAASLGRDASTVGLTPRALQDHYSGWQRLDGKQYYVNTMAHEGTLMLLAIPRDIIYEHVFAMSLFVTLCTAVVSTLIIFLLVKQTEKFRTMNREGLSAESSPAPFFFITRNDRQQITQDAASRWDGSQLQFSTLTAEQKLGRILSGLSTAISALMFLVFQFFDSRSLSPMLRHILSESWERSPNIFAISYVIIACLEIFVLSLVLRILVNWFSMGQGTRSETVCRMIQNFVKYAAVIGSILYSLQYLGVDSTAVITGTGILTLGVSLGSQSLVSDILAGVFIVFEGEFRVGDIVTIDNFRGTVEEIGIRTTKISQVGNIKIFRNSQISGVLNMTKQNSYAICTFQVSYRTPLEKLEQILQTNFPEIRSRIPELTGDLTYLGVQNLAESGVEVMVAGTCEESCRILVTRKLNREIKLLMDRSNIEIPFPQIVVHTATDEESVTFNQDDDSEEA